MYIQLYDLVSVHFFEKPCLKQIGLFEGGLPINKETAHHCALGEAGCNCLINSVHVFDMPPRRNLSPTP